MVDQNQHQPALPQQLDNRPIAKQTPRKHAVNSVENNDQSAQISNTMPIEETPTRSSKHVLPFIPSLNLSPDSDGRHTFSPAEGSLIKGIEDSADKETASKLTTGLQPLRLLRLFAELEEKHSRAGNWVQGLKPYERNISEDETDADLYEEWRSADVAARELGYERDDGPRKS